MRNEPVRVGRSVALAAAVVGIAAYAAYGHRLHVFAAADGAKISGYAYLSGGGRACNVAVQILGPGRRKLADTTTDENGEFTFTATVKCAHTFRISTADGHAATFTVRAAELPDNLPLPQAAGPAPPLHAADAPAKVPPGTGAAGDAVASEMETLRKQVAAMRRQLDEFARKRQLQDIIGGVGYIFGLAGVVFYFAARRRADRNTTE